MKDPESIYKCEHCDKEYRVPARDYLRGEITDVEFIYIKEGWIAVKDEINPRIADASLNGCFCNIDCLQAHLEKLKKTYQKK